MAWTFGGSGVPPIRIDYKLTGFKELQKKLDSLGVVVGKEVVEPVIFSWGEYLAAVFFETAPEATGFLREHFVSKVKMLSGKYGVIAGKAQVGPSKAKYPPQIKHINGKAIKSKQKHARTVQMVASWIEFGTSKKAARPFMRSAVISKADYLIMKLGEALKDALGI
jgi:hypothetical protein